MQILGKIMFKTETLHASELLNTCILCLGNKVMRK